MKKTATNILKINYNAMSSAINQLENSIKKAKTHKKKLRQLIEQEKKEMRGHYLNE